MNARRGKPTKSKWSDDWKEHAACSPANGGHIPPAWFFSNKKQHIQAALDQCRGCPVTMECDRERKDLESQHAISLSGVYGGRRWAPNKSTMPAKPDGPSPGTPNGHLNRNGIPYKTLCLLETDGGWLSLQTIAGELGADPGTVYRAAWRLKRKGLVEQNASEWRAA